jgi:hypothetical protein
MDGGICRLPAISPPLLQAGVNVDQQAPNALDSWLPDPEEHRILLVDTPIACSGLPDLDAGCRSSGALSRYVAFAAAGAERHPPSHAADTVPVWETLRIGSCHSFALIQAIQRGVSPSRLERIGSKNS